MAANDGQSWRRATETFAKPDSAKQRPGSPQGHPQCTGGPRQALPTSFQAHSSGCGISEIISIAYVLNILSTQVWAGLLIDGCAIPFSATMLGV